MAAAAEKQQEAAAEQEPGSAQRKHEPVAASEVEEDRGEEEEEEEEPLPAALTEEEVRLLGWHWANLEYGCSARLDQVRVGGFRGAPSLCLRGTGAARPHKPCCVLASSAGGPPALLSPHAL